MVVVISPESNYDNEFLILDQLFKVGLEYYHLRKPHLSYKEHCAYLDKIDSKYHSHIIVHNHHELLYRYDLKGIHYTEDSRQRMLSYSVPNDIDCAIKSSSFHSIEDIQSCSYAFNYYLLSPVFTSISKTLYEGKGFNVNKLQKKIIALGGVHYYNIKQAFQLGYNGVAVLGSIWNSTTPLQNFKAILSTIEKSKSYNER